MTNGPCARFCVNCDSGRLNEMAKCTIKRYINAINICALFFFCCLSQSAGSLLFTRAPSHTSRIHGSPEFRLPIGNTERYDVRARTFHALVTDVLIKRNVNIWIINWREMIASGKSSGACNDDAHRMLPIPDVGPVCLKTEYQHQFDGVVKCSRSTVSYDLLCLLSSRRFAFPINEIASHAHTLPH